MNTGRVAKKKKTGAKETGPKMAGAKKNAA